MLADGHQEMCSGLAAVETEGASEKFAGRTVRIGGHGAPLPWVSQAVSPSNGLTCNASWGVSASIWDSRTVTTVMVSPTALKTSSE